MTITEEQLNKCMPFALKSNVAKYIEYLNQYMPAYEINNEDRICRFLAQITHESGSLKYAEEIASGTAYEYRKDLGNTKQGDGVKYKGRGLIQITGRANYYTISKDLNEDFVSNPTLLSTPKYAVMSACWFWWKKQLNTRTYEPTGNKDKDWEADLEKVRRDTKIINGGYNGLQDRINNYIRCRKVFGLYVH